MAAARDTTSGKGGFSEAEKEAMKARAAETRPSGRRRSKAERLAEDAAKAVEAISAMTGLDRELGEGIHRIVTSAAPELAAKTWYGMPAYALNDKVVCFFQSAGKFESRYATFGFNDIALLDDGPAWPTSYAVTELTPEVEKLFATLVKRAVAQ